MSGNSQPTSSWGLHNDSFVIYDPKYLRTIFDEDVDEGLLAPPVKVAESERVEATPEAAPRPFSLTSSLDVEKVDGRARSDSVKHTPEGAGDSRRSVLHDDPRRPVVLPSPQTKAQAEATKQFVEEFYWELFTYLEHRKKREEKLRALQSLPNSFERSVAIRELKTRETVLLRSRRLCGRRNDFHLIKRIGKGSFGEVYLCRKRSTNELLALKQISKSNLHIKNQIAHVQVEQEVLADASSLWLVNLLYTFQSSDSIYFAMEYVPGGDLATYLANVGDLSVDNARFYMAEMLLAVDALHQLGYIHRDLKPDNFLVDMRGHLKLADFGLSRKGVSEAYREPFIGQLPVMRVLTPDTNLRRQNFRSRQKHERAFSLVGSPDYMAVEILRGEGYEFSVDWWSLGCMLYEMLAGFPPFNASTPRDVFDNVMSYRHVLENPATDDGSLVIAPTPWDLITSLVTEPETRLGSESVDQIKGHAFFDGFDWDNVKQMTPPFVPKLDHEEDTSYFANAIEVSNFEATDKSTPFLAKLATVHQGASFEELIFSKSVYSGNSARDPPGSRDSPERSGSAEHLSTSGGSLGSGTTSDSESSPSPSLSRLRRNNSGGSKDGQQLPR
eukprot:TRINITY_DN7406_c0_g1_i1.p1 TRINITY_DN7406_c0_g1~~TRINITY_DN7406_c0_g1_i1.p1  ORF type:complete len:613 (+),score=115.92 TRINITY_DN7406_c0_g1_i1:70-1908(+)